MAKNENGKIHTPRLCHVIKKDDFDGYGFNLHAEKGKPGQYIGKVDDGSPAETAGLKQGDRIIEVNGVNIGSETHKQVVQRIKAIASEVQLLVVDPSVPVTKDNKLVDPPPRNGSVITTVPQKQPTTVTDTTDNSTRPAAVTPTSSSPAPSITPDIIVQLPSTPSSPKDTNSPSSHHKSSPPASDNQSIETKSLPESPKSIKNESVKEVAIAVSNSPSPSVTETIKSQSSTTSSHLVNGGASTSSNSPKTNSIENSPPPPASTSTPTTPPSMGGLNLNMTAAELRAKLAAKKKFDPKTDSVDLRKKFEIVQKL